MMGRISEAMPAVYSGIATFLIILFSLFTYFYVSNQSHWWGELLHTRLLYVPPIFHLMTISLDVGLIAFLLLSLIQKTKYGGIEEKPHALSSGNYESKLLHQPIPNAPGDLYVRDIDAETTKIREKVIEISSELQIMTSRPQYVDGQTKEEILKLERRRLIRELHDSVSQQSFITMMMMSALAEQAGKSKTPGMPCKQLKMMAKTVNASQSEMRALFLHLRPVNLEEGSSKQGIEQLSKELQNKVQILLKWEVEDVKLISSVRNHLSRIVQELSSDTLRHAKANELEAYLHKIGNNLLLRIIDDGTGFNMNETEAGSYELNNIKGRVAGIDGTVKITSLKGQGTNVETKVSLMKGAQIKMVKALLADDHEMVRLGVSSYLSVQEDIEVIGETENGRQGYEKAMALRPDVILVDLVMEEMDGIGSTKAILKDRPKAKIVTVTSFIDNEKVYPAIETEAAGYLLKTFTAHEIAGAIRATQHGKRVLEPGVTTKMMEKMSRRNNPVLHEELMNRGNEILMLISGGKSSQEIADELFITLKTIKAYMSSILAKLEVEDRTQATIYTFKHDLVK